MCDCKGKNYAIGSFKKITEFEETAVEVILYGIVYSSSFPPPLTPPS